MDHLINDSDRLKPCPFCGGAAEMGQVRSESGEDPNEGGYFVACIACDASTGLRFACGEDPRQLLIEQWNRRIVQEHGRTEVWPLTACGNPPNTAVSGPQQA